MQDVNSPSNIMNTLQPITAPNLLLMKMELRTTGSLEIKHREKLLERGEGESLRTCRLQTGSSFQFPMTAWVTIGYLAFTSLDVLNTLMSTFYLQLISIGVSNTATPT